MVYLFSIITVTQDIYLICPLEISFPAVWLRDRILAF